ncbi:MAG: thioredoxin [Ignavibacteria bacterium]|nr:MAG: thioredoxin [Ignavibacteria bacterium]
MKPIEITDANFEQEVLNSDIPVVVDFWAVWCGPCRMVAPIMEELAEEFDGKVKIGKLDVDQNQNSAIKYGVRSIPTILFFKGGELKDTVIGAGPKAMFVEKVENLLNA